MKLTKFLVLVVILLTGMFSKVNAQFTYEDTKSNKELTVYYFGVAPINTETGELGTAYSIGVRCNTGSFLALLVEWGDQSMVIYANQYDIGWMLPISGFQHETIKITILATNKKLVLHT